MDIRMIWKESILEDAEGLAEKFRFRSLGQWSSDLLYDVASGRNPSRKSVGSSGRHTSSGRIVNGKVGKAGFPTAAGGS